MSTIVVDRLVELERMTVSGMNMQYKCEHSNSTLVDPGHPLGVGQHDASRYSCKAVSRATRGGERWAWNGRIVEGDEQVAV